MIRLRYLCLLSIFFAGFTNEDCSSLCEQRSELVNPKDWSNTFGLVNLDSTTELVVDLPERDYDLVLSVVLGLFATITGDFDSVGTF